MMNLKDLATICGKPFEIEKKDGIWRCHIRSLEVIQGGLLASAYGRGTTRALAIKDYVSDLEGKRVVVDAWRDTRREFQLPDKMSIILR